MQRFLGCCSCMHLLLGLLGLCASVSSQLAATERACSGSQRTYAIRRVLLQRVIAFKLREGSH